MIWETLFFDFVFPALKLFGILFVFFSLCIVLERIMNSRKGEIPIEKMSRYNCKDVGVSHVLDATGQFCLVCGERIPSKRIGIFYPD